MIVHANRGKIRVEINSRLEFGWALFFSPRHRAHKLVTMLSETSAELVYILYGDSGTEQTTADAFEYLRSWYQSASLAEGGALNRFRDQAFEIFVAASNVWTYARATSPFTVDAKTVLGVWPKHPSDHEM